MELTFARMIVPMHDRNCICIFFDRNYKTVVVVIVVVVVER